MEREPEARRTVLTLFGVAAVALVLVLGLWQQVAAQCDIDAHTADPLGACGPADAPPDPRAAAG